jgi:hypothetical protein
MWIRHWNIAFPKVPGIYWWQSDIGTLVFWVIIGKLLCLLVLKSETYLREVAQQKRANCVMFDCLSSWWNKICLLKRKYWRDTEARILHPWHFLVALPINSLGSYFLLLFTVAYIL